MTRSNGIEHLAHFRRRQDAHDGPLRLSWPYPMYDGGFRLWEGAESVHQADAVIALNEIERSGLIDHLRAKPATTRVVPHGIHDCLTSGNAVQRLQGAPRCGRLCFLCSWLQRKGVAETAATVDHLMRAGIRLDLLVAAPGVPAVDVLAAFPPEAYSHVRAGSRYDRSDLPQLLRDRVILVFPGRFEGFALAVLEAMVCGVVPIATPVGAVLHEIK